MITIRFAAAAVLLTAAPVLGARPCPPDIDCSGSVAVDDLVAVITGWGTGDPVVDVNGSGTVDVDDLVEVITSWGPCQFDYGPPRDNLEAEQIALEMYGPSGLLLATDADYERIDRDLGLIRDAFPELAEQFHTPAWAPDHLIVYLVQGLPRDDYDCHNAYYDVVEETLLFSFGGIDYYVITIDGRCNVERLGTIYTDGATEVDGAEPDALIGGENTWTPTRLVTGNWQWEIDDGWYDCFDGCDCHRVYTLETDDDGAITVVSIEEFGQPWCPFKQ